MQYLSWFILFLLVGWEGRTQVFPNIQFTYLTEKEGLSNNQVRAITQDAEGFIWFGTIDGLNRFDGYRIRKFYHLPDCANSLVNNYIAYLLTDNKDRLWITTREGLSCYDKQAAQFRNFRHIPADTSSLADDQNMKVFLGNKDTVLLSNDTALYQFDGMLHYTRKEVGFRKMIADRKEIGSYNNLMEDKDHQLWASALNYLYLLDRKTMKVRKEFGPAMGFISVIYQDAGRHYWTGNYMGGLTRFNPDDGHFTPIRLDSTVTVNSIAEWKDRSNFRWLVLGTDNGIFLLDPVTLKSKRYSFGPNSLLHRSLPGNAICQIFVDRQNILWIATNAGVCYVEPSRQLFELWDIYPPAESITDLSSDYIYSCSENSKGYWMSRWQVPGLFCFDKTGNIKKISTVYQGHTRLELIEKLKPFYLLCQGDSVLWFTTPNGLVKYWPASGQATIYTAPGAKGYDPDIGLRTILPYDDHTWWIRTRNDGVNGIFIFDPVAGKFTRHFTCAGEGRDSAPAKLLDIMLTEKKEIYLTSRTDGLYKYDRQADRFIPVFKFQGKDAVQHSNNFSSVAEDRNGILWIGTFTGLFALDPVTKKIIRDYSSNALFGGVETSKVFIDDQQNIWVNTARGIFCIVAASGQLKQVGHSHGLPNNLAEGVLQSGRDHFIYSAIRGFVVRIQPSGLLADHHRAAIVHFSEVSIMDTPSIFHFAANGQKQILLEPGQDRFTVDFSVMNYDIPGNNRYYYRLDGMMDSWQQNETGHLAFFDLPTGTYRLEIKGGTEQADDLPGTDFLIITIRPHWWQTGWLIACCILAAAILIAVAVRRRIAGIRKEAAFLQQQANFRQKMAETEMQALRAQMNPHFIFNSLNSIENFMMNNDKEQASDYFGKFATLIRMILDSSRNERVPFARDMEALQLYVELEQLRFGNMFTYRTDIDAALLNEDFCVPPLLIQPYVENAILHGLAQSDKPDLQLTVIASLKDDYLIYTIQDNGIGRRKAESYQQHKTDHHSMGLQITRERIDILNQQQHAGAGVEITDLYDEKHEACGTKVQLRLKAG